MYWLVNADAPAVTGPMDKGDTWFFGATLPEGMKLEGEEREGAHPPGDRASICRSSC